MSPLLHDPAAVEHDDVVGMVDRGQLMGHHEYGPVLAKVIDDPLDPTFVTVSR